MKLKIMVANISPTVLLMPKALTDLMTLTFIRLKIGDKLRFGTVKYNGYKIILILNLLTNFTLGNNYIKQINPLFIIITILESLF